MSKTKQPRSDKQPNSAKVNQLTQLQQIPGLGTPRGQALVAMRRALSASCTMSPKQMAFLQRVVGNQALRYPLKTDSRLQRDSRVVQDVEIQDYQLTIHFVGKEEPPISTKLKMQLVPPGKYIVKGGQGYFELIGFKVPKENRLRIGIDQQAPNSKLVFSILTGLDHPVPIIIRGSKQTSNDIKVMPSTEGWLPKKQKSSMAIEYALLVYHGDEKTRERIHQHNLKIIQTYFIQYNQYLATYRQKVKSMKSESQLRKLGKFQSPQNFPIGKLKASKEEFNDLLRKINPDDLETWKQITNKVSMLRDEIPAGTLFLRLQIGVKVTQETLTGFLNKTKDTKSKGDVTQQAAAFSFDGNIDFGNNEYLKLGQETHISVENPLANNKTETSVGQKDGNPEAKIALEGKKKGFEYGISNKSTAPGKPSEWEVKLSKSKWGVEVSSDGGVKIEQPFGPLSVISAMNPSKAEFTPFGLKFEVESKNGDKFMVYIGVHFVGLTNDKSLTAIVGQGYFESDPQVYEKTDWNKLVNRTFQAGFAAIPLVYKNAQEAYMALGFTKEKWQAFVSNPSTLNHFDISFKKFWSKLTYQERIAATTLGYYEGAWDQRASWLYTQSQLSVNKQTAK